MLLLFALANNRFSHDVANTKYTVANKSSDQTALYENIDLGFCCFMIRLAL